MSDFGNNVRNVFRKCESTRYDFYKWRSESTILNKFVLALGFACLTGLMAQLRFYLPYTPVPVTYAGIGAAGVPWFNGGKAGLDVMTGVTGGYIIGFIAAALLIGWFTDSYIKSRSFLGLLSEVSRDMSDCCDINGTPPTQQIIF